MLLRIAVTWVVLLQSFLHADAFVRHHHHHHHENTAIGRIRLTSTSTSTSPASPPSALPYPSSSSSVARQCQHRHQRHSPSSLSAASPMQQDPYPVRLNEFFKRPVPPPIKKAFSIFTETPDIRLDDDAVTVLTAAPGRPGVPRPLWLVMLASLPTGLLWYGYYKFAVEEEMLQYEIDAGIEPQGFGGYGTLGPFTYGMLMGPLAAVLHLPGGMSWSLLGICFIYYTQFLLYERVNQAYGREGLMDPPLQVMWCAPILFPLNVVVGLRQVHFLSQFFYRQRGLKAPLDPVAEFFPFVKAPPFTWQEFFLRPSLWCKLLSDEKDIDLAKLPPLIRQVFDSGTVGTAMPPRQKITIVEAEGSFQ